MKRIISTMLIVSVFGLITFFPNFGLLFLAINNFAAAPVLVSIGVLVWSFMATLILPLTKSMFQVISTTVLVGITGIITYLLQDHGFVNILTTDFWLTYGIGFAFAILGWLTVSSRVFRIVRGVVPVDTGEDDTID